MTHAGEATPIAVSLTHGDLTYARYPLAVGHYRHDVIVSAEAVLDAALGHVLRERFDLMRYPGALGTCAIIRHTVRPRGAIVVGLGDVGELTPQRLRETFAVALKEYALDVAQDPPQPGRPFRSAAFSTLLVGTDGGSSGTLADSILAILRAAIDTNRALRNARLLDKVRIDAVEFIELFEDTATRAAHVIADLPGALERELEPEEKLTGSRMIEVAPGSRYLRPATPYSLGWWQRIGVQEKVVDGDRSGSRSESTTQLKFTVLTDRARLEQDVTTGQRALVQELITSATSRTAVDLELSATLYQLLVPAAVRDRISQGADVLFMLDRVGAGFPFELMATRGNDGKFHPLIETHGILRQFETDQYELRPEMARTKRMFVIGNPRTMLWPSLPGAEREAKAVKKLAAAHGLEVTHPEIDAQEMITWLLTGEYQIVHIAAHGQYDPDPMRSGVVIGDRVLITPAEVARMPLVPELVFLNCCYLGKMGEGRSTSPDPRLASSLAEGFIRAGARAVIAAGWAVDDKAGTTFATTFYEAFLSGASFGDAVKQARQVTAGKHATNTWGAYQCYGNPDFRLLAQKPSKRAPRPPALVTRSESLQALRTIASRARSRRHEDEASSLTTEFDTTFGAIPADKWRADGELLTAAAEITGELRLFDKAIDYYRKALQSQPASAPIIAIEQLVNLLARSAATKVMTTGKVDPKSAKAFEEAEDWLDWLDKKLAPTRERRSIRGSLYKRLSLSVPARRVEYLQKALKTYGPAAEAEDDFLFLNAIALAFVLADASGVKALAAQVDAFQQHVGSRSSDDRDFWGIVLPADTLLIRTVLHRAFTPQAIEKLLAAYAEAWQVGPSLREWASVTDHIWFLHAMTSDNRLPCHDRTTADALKHLHDRLVARTFTDAPPGVNATRGRRETKRAVGKTRTPARRSRRQR
jgi:tetratricopeptide (TPR) repeat protein